MVVPLVWRVTLETPDWIIVPRGTLELVHVLEGLLQTGTRKLVGDAKCTDSLGDFVNERAGRKGVKDAGGLGEHIVVGDGLMVGFEYPHSSGKGGGGFALEQS